MIVNKKIRLCRNTRPEKQYNLFILYNKSYRLSIKKEIGYKI